MVLLVSSHEVNGIPGIPQSPLELVAWRVCSLGASLQAVEPAMWGTMQWETPRTGVQGKGGGMLPGGGAWCHQGDAGTPSSLVFGREDVAGCLSASRALPGVGSSGKRRAAGG